MLSSASSPSTPSALPVISGDLPIGMTEEEFLELAALQALNISSPPPATADAEEEEEQVSPVTSHPARTSSGDVRPGEWCVRLEKKAGAELGVELKRAGILGKAVEVVSIKHGSMLLNECREGDLLLSINGRAVSDAERAAKELTAAKGQVVLGLKRAPAEAPAVPSSHASAKVSTPRRARYSLSAMLGRSDSASLLASQ